MDDNKKTDQGVPVQEQLKDTIYNKLSEGKTTLNEARVSSGLNTIADGDIRITKAEFDSMNYLDIRELVLKIMNKAMEKTENTSSDVFIDFQGHVKKLDIRIFVNGWKRREERSDDDIVIAREVSFEYDPKESVLSKLQEVYELLYLL